ncbi:TAXI family TRAP transporter solute-binding subunit [Magnetospirillum sp. SS-4]|uniref:TAXI family TRAP transporter solute-binding subunit n=1 Tax=Magnetospirillum sp. SS-4 TaxID=2681465 RepID=UPI0020C4AFA2|nr:TAXI family TRAP transporter solute-binding subunit [Magnetospirillum sp. SS-4]
MPVPMRFGPFRRTALASLAILATLAAGPGDAAAQDIRFFQIGTGPTGETRFSIGGLIANAISNPPGSRECDKGGSCGVPGMVAVAKSTGGSLANVEAIGAKRMDAALVQADIAYWAYHGTGLYKGKGAVQNLRAIAMLYPESLHLVTRKDAAIASVRDLKGKRVSFGDKDAAEQVHGRMLLSAFGLPEAQVKLTPMKPGAAADALVAGKLDAMLVVDGYPVPALADLAQRVDIALVPLDGPEIDKMRAKHPFLTASAIPADTYKGVDAEVRTLDLGVMLITGAAQPDELIYGVTRALWHPSTQKLLAESHPRGKLVQLSASALERTGIQLHGGASAYYFDAGVIK